MYSCPLSKAPCNPGNGFFTVTPASIKDMDPPQTVAIDEDPLDSSISETSFWVGKDPTSCRILLNALSAGSRDDLPPAGPLSILTSPTEKGGE